VLEPLGSHTALAIQRELSALRNDQAVSPVAS
jgi:hypothetical protein